MAVTYDFQTPGVSTSAADTQEDIRNIAEMSWVWHVNASQHTLTNKPTGLIEAFYDSTVDFTSSIPAYGYQNYYSLKAYDGTNLGNVNFMQLYVHNDGAVLSNTVGTRGQEFISMGATAGYSCQSLAPWTINADVGNSGTTTYDPILAFQNQSTERARIYTDTSDSHKLKFDVGGSDQMVIDSSGNVGIGTSSPSARFEVADSATSGTILRISNNNDFLSANDFVGKLEFYSEEDSAPANTVRAYVGAKASDAFNRVDLVFATGDYSSSATERMVIDPYGNVGIGTSSPSAKLTVNKGDDIGFIVQDNTTDNHRLHMMTSASDNGYYIGYASGQIEGYKLNSSGHSYFLGGNVGIGTNSPSHKLDVVGDIQIDTGNLVIGTSGKGIDFSATSDAAGATSELLDDYEEGTFTPVIYYRDLSANGGLGADASFSISSYTAQTGTYTKIGDTVRIKIRIKTNTLSGGDPTDEVRISGLPFVASSDIASYPATILSQDFSANPPKGAAIIGGDDIIFLYRDASSTSSLTKLQVSDLSGGSNNNDILITGIYYI